jgi:anti-sigma factor RsiW
MMRCEEIAIELDAYRTAELDADKSAAIERHLRQCPNCRAELEAMRTEDALYHEYQSQAQIPSPDWIKAHIEKVRSSAQPSAVRIRKRPSAIPRWTWPVAATVLLAVGLSWHFYSHRSAPELAGPGVSQLPHESQPLMQQAVNDFEHAVGLLRASYAEKKRHLDPKLVMQLDASLEVTQTAIAECKQAMQKNPNNEQAVEFLIFDYEKQIDILRQIMEES